MGHVISKAYDLIIDQKYGGEVDSDIIADDVIQENIISISNIVSMVDYIYGMDSNTDEYTQTLKSIEKETLKTLYNITATMELAVDMISMNDIIDKRANDIGLLNTTYYNEKNIFTKLTTYSKFKNKGALQSGIKVAIGGGKNINLDFSNIKDMLFDALYYNALIIGSIREKGINGNNLPELILDLLLSLVSLGILINIDIEDYNG